MGEDLSKHRAPLSMKELVEKTWANWGLGNEITPEQSISENWHKLVGKKLHLKCAPKDFINQAGYFMSGHPVDR